MPNGEAGAGDLPLEEYRRLMKRASAWVEDYLSRPDAVRVFPHVQPGALRETLPPSPPEEPEALDDALDDFQDLVVPALTHWNHPRFFGYFPSSGSFPGIVGEFLAAAVNTNAMIWHSSPGGTELEEVACDWLRQLLGLPGEFEGVINDTASSSTLYALAAARSRALPEAHTRGLAGLPAGRVYASEEAHASVDKAVLTLGLGQEGMVKIATDAAGALIPDALAARIREDRARGHRPVAVVATIGTTSTTAVDPLAEIAAICAGEGVWLHVDAAYGGAAALLPEKEAWFRGWERADSVVMNPHKWLFTPIDCSVLFTRRPRELAAAFALVPDYLNPEGRAASRNLMDYGVALGRRLRALKLWFVMRAYGRSGLVQRLRRHIEWAERFAGWVDETRGWELVAPVPFSTVCFRCSDLDDAGNLAVLERVNRSGRVFLTHTTVGGRVTLRLAVGHIRTTLADVQEAWDLLRDAGDEVRRAGRESE